MGGVAVGILEIGWVDKEHISLYLVAGAAGTAGIGRCRKDEEKI